MGECNYYLKARFENDRAAVQAIKPLAVLMAEGEKAYMYWQGARCLGRPTDKQPSAEQFWAGFRQQFPLTCIYLGLFVGIKDWSDGLAGTLGCLVDPLDDRKEQPRASVVRQGDELHVSLEGIWHFTNLGFLETYIEEVLGAVAVGSLSDEDWDEDERETEDFDPFLEIEV
jgi:hypothetical protein